MKISTVTILEPAAGVLLSRYFPNFDPLALSSTTTGDMQMQVTWDEVVDQNTVFWKITEERRKAIFAGTDPDISAYYDQGSWFFYSIETPPWEVEDEEDVQGKAEAFEITYAETLGTCAGAMAIS
jgi:hypothetical protein